MRCDEFRDRLQEALASAGLFASHVAMISETLDIGTMERRWRLGTWRSSPRQVEPFHVSTTLSFRWSPLQAARSYTCEEDVLTEMLGRRASPARIERRFVRIDVTMRARLPYGSSAAVPAPSVLGSWLASVNDRLHASLAPAEDEPHQAGADTGLGEPIRLQCRCAPDGSVVLDGVDVSAFQIVRVPRLWDDPRRREREPGIEPDLAGFAGRITAGLDAWTQGIAELATWMKHVPPSAPLPPDAEWDRDDDASSTRH